MQETQVLSFGQEDSLEKGMATHSSILAWRIPWTGEPGGPQSIGLQRVGHDGFFFSFKGKFFTFEELHMHIFKESHIRKEKMLSSPHPRNK